MEKSIIESLVVAPTGPPITNEHEVERDFWAPAKKMNPLPSSVFQTAFSHVISRIRHRVNQSVAKPPLQEDIDCILSGVQHGDHGFALIAVLAVLFILEREAPSLDTRLGVQMARLGLRRWFASPQGLDDVRVALLYAVTRIESEVNRLQPRP